MTWLEHFHNESTLPLRNVSIQVSLNDDESTLAAKIYAPCCEGATARRSRLVNDCVPSPCSTLALCDPCHELLSPLNDTGATGYESLRCLL